MNKKIIKIEMKKFIQAMTLTLLGAIVISLSSCQAIEKKLFPYAGTAEKMRDSVMDCFTDQNVEVLKDLFCDEIKNTHDLDEEIQAAFEFIQGNIVSYDLSMYGPSGEEVRDGKVVLKDRSINVDKIITDLDNEYKIAFNYYLVNEEHKDMVGITFITVTDKKSTESISIG